MIKTVLVPIDFTIESLNTLKITLNDLVDTQVNVVLMYSEYTSDSITELLFYSPEKRLKTLLKPEFMEALTAIKNRFENVIDCISIEFFHGYGVNAFVNFVEGKKIDIISIPSEYKLKPQSNGFDPLPIIKKSKLPYQEVNWLPNKYAPKEEELSHLFNYHTA
jgi:hypothetical protein